MIVGRNSSQSGVGKKITKQLFYWRELGHEARLFEVPEDPIQFGLNIAEVASKILKRLKAVKAVKNDVIQWSPDLIYARSGLTYYRSFELLVEKYPTILEVNTNELGEYRIMYPALKYLFYLAMRRRYITRAAGFLCVSRELCRDYLLYNKPIKVIGNGITLEEISELPAVEKEQVEIVFIGASQYPWNGIDKVIELARLFPSWIFHIIGIQQQECLNQNVIFHGHLEYSEYMKYMERADAAIGTLALHRKCMNEASPLKVREYLAHGIPVIIGYDDTDFPCDVGFLLRIPNSEKNTILNAEAINKFVLGWIGKRINRGEILAIDNRKKEKERIEFFDVVLAKRRNSYYQPHGYLY